MAEEYSLRETYGKTLVELGKESPEVVVLDADLSHSTMTMYFAREFPTRFFNCGIAEQNMISIAAGLAASGKTPFASTFAVFLPGRCFDQVRVSVVQPGLNVKLVSTHGGLTVGEDDISHQAIEDFAMATSLPGLTVIVPADAGETAQAIRSATATKGPFYIRLPRPKLPNIYPDNYKFVIGKGVTLKSGNDATIIALGVMVKPAIEAANQLVSEGVSCRVISMPTLKPIDEESIINAARETGAIVTAEEHLENGGLGSAVARILGKYCPVPLETVAVKDTYAMSGKSDELMHKYGLTAENIIEATRKAIARKP